MPSRLSAGRLRSARRLLRRKGRAATGRFLVEGRQAVREALGQPEAASAPTAVEVFVAEDAVDRHTDLLNEATRRLVAVATVAPEDFAVLADTVTPQGILAVCRRLDVPLTDALTSSASLVVLCDRVRDPGNLGTVIRCADAFGADSVLVGEDSVDLYNSKTVRASTGSLFHLPIAADVPLADAADLARRLGLKVLGADGGAHCTLDDLGWSGELGRPTLWVFGNEAWGLPQDRAALLDRLVAAPLYGRAESLNLSTAAAVFLYASATAQRAAGRSEDPKT